VVIARHPDSVIDAYTFDQSIVGELVNAAIVEFTGEEAPGLAWASLFPDLSSSTVIGIKVNCFNTSNCCSHPEIGYAIAEGLASMPVGGGHLPRNNFIIWDCYNSHLTGRGDYTLYTDSDPNTVRCYGSDEAGWDAAIDVNGVACYPSMILTQQCQYLVNLAILKNHSTAGVTLGLKNHLGSIQNPGHLPHGGNYLDPEIPELNYKIQEELSPQDDDKEKITIIDSLVGMESGGPTGPPRFIYGGIILGTDPVAVDYVGREVLGDHGCATLYKATHIDTAAGPPYSLGTNDPAQMDVMTHNPIAPAHREHVDKMIRFHKEGLATELQVQWAVDRYSRGL
jgi:hypothetical protein